MRNTFDEQLDLLNKELITMGALCETAIANVTTAFLNNQAPAFVADNTIDQKEREIENLCLKLLLQQQPVARDLRQISAVLKMITDMERIGDQAEDIAEIISMANIQEHSNKMHIKEMAKATIKMVTESIDAYVRKDIVLAQDVIAQDDVVDALFVQVKNELIEALKENTAEGEVAIDMLMIAKYFERIGDHATNIAEWVVFSITGNHKTLK